MEDYFSTGPMSGSTDVLFSVFTQDNSPYQAESVMGTGKMSWVLRAHDTATRAVVALKVLRPSMSRDPETLRRFFREAEVLASIDHPGVVRLIAHGTFDGFPYTALELIEGATLDARLLRKGPFAWGDAVACLLDLSGALAVAHARGVVHRDLKPQNILITPEGRGKITDFGLVQVEGARRITARIRVLGTPLYTAPEILDGKPATPASDLYALGALASEMLRGKPPYEARDLLEIVERHRSPDRGFPRDYPPATPPALIALIDSLLALDPAVRPADAAAVVAALSILKA